MRKGKLKPDYIYLKKKTMPEIYTRHKKGNKLLIEFRPQ